MLHWKQGTVTENIKCGIKESQRKYILSVLKCLDSFEPIALYL